MGVKRYTAEQRNAIYRQRRLDWLAEKAKKIIQEMGDGQPHKVEIYLTEFYGNNRFITAPYSNTTLLIDGHRELGGKIEDGISSKMTEFIWYGTENGRKPHNGENDENQG